jgi:hypothetical protein
MALLGDRMTLAVILLCCASPNSWVSPNTQTGSSPQQNPPSTDKPSASAPAQPTASAPAKAKHHRHKKRVADPCTTTSSTPAATQSGETAAHAAPTNCPPPKVIVRQGGTSEPSIQLAGKPSTDDQSQQNETTKKLGETGENLKKIEGRQLTSDQQDMLNQIKQFMEQSKSATDARDLDRAYKLAVKAELLSEELVKPKQ